MALQVSLLGATPAIDTTGLAPYTVQGDPVQALIAQLNRFAGKTLAVGSCRAARYVSRTIPLSSGLTYEAALLAANLMYSRYDCVPISLWGDDRVRWIAKGRDGDVVGFVAQNLAEFTVTIAQLGDQLGLDPASVGITTVDPKLARRKMWPFYVGGAIALLGAFAFARRKGVV
jgi:hypothetical protein